MIPMELLSMLASTVLGGIMSIMAQKGQAEQEKQKIFSIIVVPIVAPIFTDVNIAYQIVTEADSGWWIFGSTYETSYFEEGNTIFITNLQSHTIFSIIGLYFGGSLTRK